jgi:hypothetical protein
MIDEPLSLRSDANLPRLKELEVELSKGAYWLRSERRHRAGDLAGTYQIRLGIARDQGINGGIPDDENETADNLQFLVDNLNAEPEHGQHIHILPMPSIGSQWGHDLMLERV